MQYRRMNGIDAAPSIFGIGAMRLPTEADGTIKEADAIELIRRGIDGGVTYIDTAYVYHGQKSEVLLGKALADGYRERVLIATKIPCWMVERFEDFERMLDESLERLATDHVDFLLLHAVDRDRWNRMKELDYARFFADAQRKGKIRFPSFSFHDDAELFREIIDTGDFVMAQIQMNLLDVHNQATIEGMRYAADKGVNVVVMEPLRGGSLARHVPEEVQALYDAFPDKRSPVEWAFRFLYQHPEVKVILSGVTYMDQLEDDLRIFQDAQPGAPSAEEAALYEAVRAAYEARIRVGCTGCEYCMPCPSGVQIPDVFRPYDEASMFGDPERYRRHYARLVEKGGDASRCVECGACEPQCPQHIAIIEKLKEARAYAGR